MIFFSGYMKQSGKVQKNKGRIIKLTVDYI